jgi:hypothetical protein
MLRNVANASTTIGVFTSILVAVGGFHLNLASLHSSVSWLTYLSWFPWSFQLLTQVFLFERTRRRKIAKQFSDGAGVSL